MTDAQNASQTVSSQDRRFTNIALVSIPLVTWVLLFALFYPPEAPQRGDRIEAGYGEYTLSEIPSNAVILDSKRIQALQAELEKRIQAIAPHVQRARVDINTGPESGFQHEWSEPSVSVEVSSERNLTQDNVQDIQECVASVVEGVNAQSVIVLNHMDTPSKTGAFLAEDD